MDKKSLMKDIGYKLRKIRESQKYRTGEMAAAMNTWQSTYSRHEKGETPLNILSLYQMAKRFNISLDWLILNEGPMYRNKKETQQTPETKPHSLEILGEDAEELLEHMANIKLLRYEIFVYFQKFKNTHKDLVESEMTKDTDEKTK